MTAWSLMPRARFETFTAIVENNPKSIYELAKTLGKDEANVLREVRALEGLGLVEIKESTESGRKSLKPKPLFSKVVFEIQPKISKKVGN
jgi:predicted transcriptional regulator